MDKNDVSRWFADYVGTFAACCRGETDARAMLTFYAVPLLRTSDAGVSSLTTSEQVTAMVRQQAADLQAADYAGSEILDFEVTVLNAVSALYRGTFSRHTRTGGEISRFGVTYLIVDREDGRRIIALAAHGAR